VRRHDIPREGSKIRALYDAFLPPMSVVTRKRAEEILGSSSSVTRQIDALRDFYDLDIECVRKGEYRLVGQFIGGKYVSHRRSA
jgi:hypothetical protein